MKRVFAALFAICLLTTGAVGGVAADSTATPTAEETPTPTPTATPDNETTNTTETETGTETATSSEPEEAGPKPAELYVEQPRHITSTVQTDRTDSSITYTVSGEILEIEPKNFDADTVVDASVREGEATLRFDDGIDRWLLDTQGVSGSYQLTFRTRANGTYTTYHATINVEQADYAHLAPSQVDGMQEQADNWEFVVDEFQTAGLIGDDADVEQVKAVVEDAVTWYKFYDNPLSGLSGQFLTFAIMLAKWPAGWIILGTIAIVTFWRVGVTKKENRKLKRQFADIENIDESKREAQERELKRILSTKTFQDLGLTDTDAQAVKEHCGVDNPRQFLDRFTDFFTETGRSGCC